MERLAFSFVLGYHGCDRSVGERVLNGDAFVPSNNEYDWLGPGVYFWEANPLRGLQWAVEQAKRPSSKIREPFVVGAVIDLGNCLDLSTAAGCQIARGSFELLQASGTTLPVNGKNGRHALDCAVIRYTLELFGEVSRFNARPFDTVRGIFQEGEELFGGSNFRAKTHVQISVQNLTAIKGVFRVPERHLQSWPEASQGDRQIDELV